MKKTPLIGLQRKLKLSLRTILMMSLGMSLQTFGQGLLKKSDVMASGGGKSAAGPFTLFASLGQSQASTKSHLLLVLAEGFQPIAGSVGLGAPTAVTRMHRGWNLISVPTAVGDYFRGTLFPNAISGAYKYQGAYVEEDTLERGEGYWLRFSDADVVAFYGEAIQHDTIIVSEGWNIVGSVSDTVGVSSISSIPVGILLSPFFAFGSSGYEASARVIPGRAYWIKASSQGRLVVGGGTPIIGERQDHQESENTESSR